MKLRILPAGESYHCYASFPELIDDIKLRPLLMKVDIHWIVVRGYDDSDTPQVEADKFYVNDPYWQDK
ncbi:MAG: hypothetical protein V3V90_05000 [Thermodesulfobacteriota bacterium]